MSNKSNLFNKIKKNTGKANISDDIGIVSPNTGSSVTIKDNGDINIAVDEYTQVKISKSGSGIIENSLSNTTNAVTKELNMVDTLVNKHKFNNQFIDLTDFRDVNGNVIGGMLINGTVLVKTWEPNLEKWVLIRRPISSAMFSGRLNVPNTPEQLDVNLNITEDIRKHYIEKDKEK